MLQLSSTPLSRVITVSQKKGVGGSMNGMLGIRIKWFNESLSRRKTGIGQGCDVMD